MRIVLSVVSICLLIILKLAFQEAGLFYLAPHFALAFLCILLLFRKLEEVLWLGLFAGVLLDIFSGLPDGVMAISLPAALAGASYIGRALLNERFSLFLLPLYTLSATITMFVVALLVLSVFALLGWTQAPDWQYLITRQLLAAIALNLIALAPVYWLYLLQEKIQKRFWPKHESI